MHLGAIQENKENGEKLKIVDSSLIEKNACFLVEMVFLTISSVLHPIKSLAACNHEILIAILTTPHNNSGSSTKCVGTFVSTVCYEIRFKAECSSFACLWLCAVYVM